MEITKVNMKHELVRICSVLTLLCLSHLTTAQSTSYVLTNSNLFNGADNRIIENATVLVADGKIQQIATGKAEFPAGYEVIDCEGNSLRSALHRVSQK